MASYLILVGRLIRFLVEIQLIILLLLLLIVELLLILLLLLIGV